MAEPVMNGSTPAGLPISSEADYLRQAAMAGGRAYKSLAYDLLELQPSMHILDVGCGLGGDLLALADRVGPSGVVVGIEPSRPLFLEAYQAAAGRANIMVAQQAAETVAFTGGHTFDRVRADWVLQDVSHPQLAIANMWRSNLGPGGQLMLVEPDWKSMMLFPASPAGGDDDHSLQVLLGWYQRKFAHALIGRQLLGMVHQQAGVEHVEVQIGSLDWTSWPLADAVMRISASARMLVAAEPAWDAEIDAWLRSIATAARHGEFLASLPLIFVRAWKERYIPLSGRPSQGVTPPFLRSLGG